MDTVGLPNFWYLVGLLDPFYVNFLICICLFLIIETVMVVKNFLQYVTLNGKKKKKIQEKL